MREIKLSELGRFVRLTPDEKLVAEIICGAFEAVKEFVEDTSFGSQKRIRLATAIANQFNWYDMVEFRKLFFEAYSISMRGKVYRDEEDKDLVVPNMTIDEHVREVRKLEKQLAKGG